MNLRQALEVTVSLDQLVMLVDDAIDMSGSGCDFRSIQAGVCGNARAEVLGLAESAVVFESRSLALLPKRGTIARNDILVEKWHLMHGVANGPN
jgi:hypothetical protein